MKNPRPASSKGPARKNSKCVHRSHDALGQIDCGCEGKPEAFWCHLQQGHCTAISTGKTWSKLSDGTERVGKLISCSLCDRRNEYAVYDQPAEEPSSDRLLITVAIGDEFQKLLEITRPLFQRYAAKVGADYREITGEPRYAIWQHEKFRVHNYAKIYPRTFFIDVDCFIQESCPDLFELVPEDSIGMHNDWEFNGSMSWLTKERRLVQKFMGFPILGTECLNSGLIVHSRQHADIWTQPPKQLPKTHCSEQIWIEHQIRSMGSQVHYLHPTFNMQWWWGDYYDKHRDSSHIIHLSGCKDKMPYARELAGTVLS